MVFSAPSSRGREPEERRKKSKQRIYKSNLIGKKWLDPVFSPGRVGGEDWQSFSFSGGVFIEKKASPNEWLDGVSLIEEEYAR